MQVAPRFPMTLVPLLFTSIKTFILLLGLQEVVVVGAGVKCAALLGTDLLVNRMQADLLLILHDALVRIAEGLDELLVDTTGWVMD